MRTERCHPRSATCRPRVTRRERHSSCNEAIAMSTDGIDTISTTDLLRACGGSQPRVMHTGEPPTMGHTYPEYHPPTSLERARDFVGSIPDWVRFQTGRGGNIVGFESA